MGKTGLHLVVGMVVMALFTGLAQGAEELTLVRNGQPVSSIVLAQEPTRAAQLAALELQHYLQLITGAEVPIRRDDGTVEGTVILVGDTPRTRVLGLDPAMLGEQEYLVEFRPGALVLLGKDKADTGHVTYDMQDPAQCKGLPGFFDEQGTLHAAYEFLEKFCGVRWFNQTEIGTVYPQTNTLTVQGENLRRKPFFRYRNALGAVGQNPGVYDRYIALWQPADDEYKAWEAVSYAGLRAQYPNPGQYEAARTNLSRLFLLRMREGGAPAVCNHSLYGYYDRFLEQTWTDRLAAAKTEEERKAILDRKAKVFEGDHPEYFAQGYEGQPLQMCYTNPGLVKQVAQDARDYYDGKSTGGELSIFWNPTLPNPFPVETMDNSAYCKCDNCRALYEDDGEERQEFSTGRFSDYFFQFVNEVARELKKTHPDAKIITLAYGSHALRPSFTLDSNVAVEFCYTANRSPFSEQYAHEERLLRDWVENGGARDMYLWLYYTFPLEGARNAKYHCFPGFFAHAIGQQMGVFHELGLKGMFHCGYGQEVESYLTFKLMDDPTLDVADLLNDYFYSMYGPAGTPMKTIYVEMEKTYSDPAFRENTRARGAELAWAVLGTEARMSRWQRLLDQAKALAQSETHKARLAAFEHGTWSYMTAGRKQYMDRMASPIPSVDVPRLAAAGGDPQKLNWDEAADLSGPWYDRGGATPSKRSYAGRIAHDGEYLYLELADECDTSKLTSSAIVFPYDDWEVFVSRQRELPYRQYASGPSGLTTALSHGEVNWRMNVPLEDFEMKVVSDTTAPDVWITRMVLPLASMLPGGVKPGETLYMNIMRISGPALSGTGGLGLDTWVSYCSVHEVDRLGELKLAP